MNRLKLDWALSTSTERNDFVQQYIQQDSFVSRPLTTDELETIANYILWGKNENGLNLDQEGLVELPRKNSTWSTQNIESLDELTESPTFNEASIYSLSSKAPTKKTRKVFSRSETLRTCPTHLLQTYLNLWKEIDMAELTINLYELEHGKRIKEPRAELLKALSEEEQLHCAEHSKTLNQRTYLKLRHHLVELRCEQYTIRDTFVEKVQLRPSAFYQEEEVCTFDADYPVMPLGVVGANAPQTLIFKPFNELNPSTFTETQLKQISDFYWTKSSQKMDARCVHFTDLETVYQLFLMMEELEDEPEELYSSFSVLLETLKYYIKETDLSETQKEILEKKIRKEKNQDIADYINKKYGKTYTANYISTIFRQKIIPAINETARVHEKIIENLFFKEEFKVCSRCGRSLLRDPINFVRKSRAKDGLSNRCKCCDKLEREEKKQKEVRNDG